MSNFYRLSLTVLLTIAACGAACAQGKITGLIYEKAESPALFATVALTPAGADSTILKGTFTNESGSFSFADVPFGSYKVIVTYVGFDKVKSAPFTLTETNPILALDRIVLQTTATQLNEVVVKARRQVIERQADRFIFNVSSSTFSSSKLLDIFRATPFMKVEGKSVELKGKSNLLVVIDGRTVPQETLGNLLQTMSGDEIEKIEFITNPSSRYEASADGVIQITTKRGLKLGLTGSVNGNISQGLYEYGNAGTNFTYRQRRFVLSGRYGYSAGRFWNDNTDQRVFNLPDGTHVFDGKERGLYRDQTHSAQLGIDYNLSARHTLSLLVEGSLNRTPGSSLDSYTTFSGGRGLPADSSLTAPKTVRYRTQTQTFSLVYRGVLDSTGRELTVSVSNTPIQGYLNSELHTQTIAGPKQDVLRTIAPIRNLNPYAFSIWIAQADLTWPFRKNWKAEAGLKLNYAENTSDSRQERLRDEQWVAYDAFSFSNFMTERVAAGYVNLAKTFGKTSVQAGLRGESTSLVARNVFNRSFNNLFPSMLVTHNVSDKYQLTLQYRQKILRPSFGQLLPYVIYIDAYSVDEGNIQLRPQYTNTLTLTQAINNKLYLTYEYSANKDWFMKLPQREGNLIYWRPVNLNSRSHALSAYHITNLTPWWQTSNYLWWSYIMADGLTNKTNVALSGGTWTLGTSNTFTLFKDWKLDASFTYNAPSVYGLSIAKATNYSRLAVKKELWQKKGEMTVSFEDMLMGSIYGTDLKAGDLETRRRSYQDSRRVAIGFIYRFGKTTVDTAEPKSMGDEEALKRAQKK